MESKAVGFEQWVKAYGFGLHFFDMARLHWLALTYIPQFGGATLRRLLQRFGTVEALFQATPTELARLAYLPPDFLTVWRSVSLNHAEAELAQLEPMGLTMLTWDDAAFPPQFHELASPPIVIFVRGQFMAQTAPAVAIVGSRQVSERSLATARHIAAEFAHAGWVVVSGLAIGIDTAAHEGALSQPNGRTIAILGNGLPQIYPAQNLALARQICQYGAILSEQRPHVLPEKQPLIMRNRLIAALSQAVMVVEASLTSGALATARHAQQLGRQVYAYPDSPGTDLLLRNMARPLVWGESAWVAVNQPAAPRWQQTPLF